MICARCECIRQLCTDLVDDVHQIGRVGEVTVVELQTHGALVPVAVDVVDALGVEARRPPDDAMHLVPLPQKTKQNETKVVNSTTRRGTEGGKEGGGLGWVGPVPVGKLKPTTTITTTTTTTTTRLLCAF